MKSQLYLVLLTACLAVTALPLQADEKDTAAFYKANVREYFDKTITLDVMIIRVLPVNIGNEYFAYAAFTWNDDTHSPGGGIVVVALAEDRDKVLREYGTSIERDGPRDPETETLRGTLKVAVSEDSNRYLPYIDQTDGAFAPDEAFSRTADVGDAQVPSAVPPRPR